MMRVPRRVLAPALVAALAWFASPTVFAGESPDAADAKGTGVAFEPGSPKFDDVLAKASKEGKPVFLDFFTDT